MAEEADKAELVVSPEVIEAGASAFYAWDAKYGYSGDWAFGEGAVRDLIRSVCEALLRQRAQGPRQVL